MNSDTVSQLILEPAHETRLDLSQLETDLQGQEALVTDTIPAFDPKRHLESFKTCEASVAENTRNVWEDYWRNNRAYCDTIRDARSAVRNWPFLMARYDRATQELLKEAKDKLIQGFKAAILQKKEIWAQAKSIASQTRDEANEAQRKIDAFIIGVTGEQDGRIPPRNSFLMISIALVAALIYALAEAAAGTDFFRQVGSNAGALGAMILVVFIVTLLAFAVGTTGKRWLCWRRAARAFARNFPAGVIPDTGLPVRLYDLDSKFPITFVAAFTALLIGSVSLVVWRLWLAESNVLLRGTSAIVWTVFAAQWVLAGVEFYSAPGYEAWHNKKLDELKADKAAKSDAAQGTASENAAPALRLPPTALEAAQAYQKSFAELRKNLVAESETARRICETYLLHRRQREDAVGDLLVPSFRKQLSDFATGIRAICLDNGIDPLFFENLPRLDITTVCASEDEPTFAEISEFHPEIDFPDGELISDFQALYWETRRNIEDDAKKEQLEAKATLERARQEAQIESQKKANGGLRTPIDRFPQPRKIGVGA